MRIQSKLFCATLAVAALFFVSMITAASAETISTARLLTKAYAADTIDRETYIIQTLRSYFAPGTVDAKFKGSISNEPTRAVTPLLDEAQKNYSSFSPESRAFLDMLLKRPADTTYTWPWDAAKDFYLPAPVSIYAPTAAEYPNIGDKFKFHYVTHATADGNGTVHTSTLDFVKKIAAAFETVYKKEITDMGFAAPPSDPGTADYGGDAKFDVYVMNSGFESVYGYVSREGLDKDNSYYGFMVMDNNFTEFATATITAEQAMQVTAAHEYHHVVQNGINGLADSWYKEASSTWMEDQVFDAVDDNLQYLNGTGANDFFYFPEKSLSQPDDHWYGTWIFNEFLETKWDQATIKSAWDNLDPVGKNTAIDALETTLTGKGSTLKDAFTAFAAKNYSQVGFYKDAVKYDEVKIANAAAPHTLDFSTATSHTLTEKTTTVNHLAAKYYKIVPGATLKDPAELSIKVKGAADKINGVAIAKNKGGTTFTEYPFSINATTNEGEVIIGDFSSGAIQEVVLALVNYSKADDAVEIKYSAQLLKGFVFVIDDTGSMGDEITMARAAAVKVLDENKAAGNKRAYTLISFKDGSGTIVGQSSDEEIMKGYVNTLYASGGWGCPESSLISIRRAADLAPGSDIMMITDADSNSYGVDDTYATWGELYETIFKLTEKNCRLHNIIYSDCFSYAKEKLAGGACNDEMLQCPGCFFSDESLRSLIKHTAGSPSGVEGYNLASTETGGLYFRVASSDTEAAAEIIIRKTTIDTTIALFDAVDNAVFTVPVDSSVSELQVVVNVDPGTSAALELKNPAGTVVDGETEGVSVVSVGGSTFYLISDAAVSAGAWTATITGTGTYRFSVDGATTNPMVYSGDISVSAGSALNLIADFDAAVTSAVFKIVNLDGSDLSTVPATTTDNKHFTGSVTLSAVGSYRIKATAAGNIQRMHTATIAVGTVDVRAPAARIAVAGDTFTYEFTIKNLASADDTFNIYAYTTRGWADLSGVPVSVLIAAGDTASISIPVAVPLTAVAGDIDRLSVQAVSQAVSTIHDAGETQTIISIIYDFDSDGDVDVADITAVSSLWNSVAGDSTYDSKYDLDSDGDIDIVDIMKVSAQWGWTDTAE